MERAMKLMRSCPEERGSLMLRALLVVLLLILLMSVAGVALQRGLGLLPDERRGIAAHRARCPRRNAADLAMRRIVLVGLALAACALLPACLPLVAAGGAAGGLAVGEETSHKQTQPAQPAAASAESTPGQSYLSR
jgi:hypothetical protein